MIKYNNEIKQNGGYKRQANILNTCNYSRKVTKRKTREQMNTADWTLIMTTHLRDPKEKKKERKSKKKGDAYHTHAKDAGNVVYRLLK